MTGYSQPGSRQSEKRARSNQYHKVRETECHDLEAGLVQLVQACHRSRQHQRAELDQQPCQQPAEQAVPDPAVEEGPADKGVGRADQLGDDDFLVAVLNVQADEPEINVKDLFELIDKCDQGQWSMGTLCTAFPDQQSWENPNAVKLLLNQKDEAIYFSRHPLPWGGDHACSRVFHHLGVYIYQRNLLESWSSLPIGPLEGLERLEQLRALENGISIVAHQITCAHKGIDTIDDYRAFVQRFKEE